MESQNRRDVVSQRMRALNAKTFQPCSRAQMHVEDMARVSAQRGLCYLSTCCQRLLCRHLAQT